MPDLARPSKGFWILAALFLIWSFMGDAAYLMQSTADLDKMAKTEPYQAKQFAEMPQWTWIVYAVAVGAATVGSILLLMRRKLAVIFYLVSLIAVVAQFSYSFLATDLLAMEGLNAAVFPIVIFGIAVTQLLFARKMAARGVLR